MGDRANVAVKAADDDIVFLYTHNSGSGLGTILARALARRLRWNDPQYLARIIFAEMTKGQEAEETGYGISAQIGDGDDRVWLVDVPAQTVTYCRWQGEPDAFTPRSPAQSFDDFLAMMVEG